MQFHLRTRHIHTLIFETEAAAYAAHSHVVGLVSFQFESWDVQAGGRRAWVVLDRRPPVGTWRYLFATTGPLTSSQIDRIHLATGADEALWNQV